MTLLFLPYKNATLKLEECKYSLCGVVVYRKLTADIGHYVSFEQQTILVSGFMLMILRYDLTKIHLALVFIINTGFAHKCSNSIAASTTHAVL